MSYKTAIEVDREAHQYLFGKKKRPSESFNSALKRELGIAAPDGTEENAEDVAAETES